MLESPLRGRRGPMERLGVRRAGLGRLSHLATHGGATALGPLVAGEPAGPQTLVIQQLVARLSGGTLGHPRLSGHLDADPGQLA